MAAEKARVNTKTTCSIEVEKAHSRGRDKKIVFARYRIELATVSATPEVDLTKIRREPTTRLYSNEIPVRAPCRLAAGSAVLEKADPTSYALPCNWSRLIETRGIHCPWPILVKATVSNIRIQSHIVSA
jgi:hypothetical protein